MDIKPLPRRLAATSLALAFAGPAAAQVSPASMHDAASQKVLAAIEHTPTAGHPDLYGEFAGMQHLASGDYKAAMKYFLIGASYADKLSQLSIGLMYLNGQGVKKDPVTAFAWIAIAAERKYPRFLATRDAVWAGLDAQQREQAKALIERLYPEYGDLTAQPRMAKRLRWERTELTGSYLGEQIGPMASLTPGEFTGTGAQPPCGAATIGGVPITGCGNLADVQWYWDPKDYFKARDAEWSGTVTVGKVNQGVTSQGK
ncbi:sel1 repeat family protein [Fulvimonas sp. R45]|uniref:sel1 repeat family protein n=1 Tax=Fulvimonas sp. R45 TaxID=3045937 RepID=UPI00265E182A|nr:sel1 repeat family protein [Fulvimonas sp. R45]MDO1529143.1 sel1 repeat family protein [Fulvimonas sp. R45]